MGKRRTRGYSAHCETRFLLKWELRSPGARGRYPALWPNSDYQDILYTQWAGHWGTKRVHFLLPGKNKPTKYIRSSSEENSGGKATNAKIVCALPSYFLVQVPPDSLIFRQLMLSNRFKNQKQVMWGLRCREVC